MDADRRMTNFSFPDAYLRNQGGSGCTGGCLEWLLWIVMVGSIGAFVVSLLLNLVYAVAARDWARLNVLVQYLLVYSLPFFLPWAGGVIATRRLKLTNTPKDQAFDELLGLYILLGLIGVVAAAIMYSYLPQIDPPIFLKAKNA